MDILTAIIYGIVQGLTEFLPVSSSGHLALLSNFFGTDMEGDSFAFTILLHLGTLFAVLVAYRKDVWELIKGFFALLKRVFTWNFKEKLTGSERLLIMLIIATLPLVVVAVFGLDEYVEAISGISWAIGLFLIVTGIMLWLADKLPGGKLTLETSDYKPPVIVGLVQTVLGIFPGISRSGSTIVAGLFAGLERKDAVRFSFLLSIPAILGANILKLPEFFGDASLSANLVPYLFGVLAAAISGFAAIKLLQYMAKSNKLSYFTVYCVIVGVAAIVGSFII